ncbi:Diaminopimelate decarboxylase [hydrothermal vent metagenome]|uniref:Diaminopimelate decarboxylase n=1 Tax=hydrothermal vent metagenome TaxID=652676 RepID=A0A3B0RHT2_9ZZZZ
MDHFQLKDGVLHAENIALPQIASEVGTPVYIYSRATLERHARVFREGLSALGDIHLAFAVKSNPNLAVLRILANQGYGADVVSGGELERALAAGMKASDIVFSGVGKSRAELVLGLDKGIGQFNLESEEEGEMLANIAAERGEKAHATLRVNPDVDAETHAKISTGKAENKFGVAIDVAPDIYARLSQRDGLDLRGVAVHIGSQLQKLEPLEKCYSRIGQLVTQLREAGHIITHVDLGGGLGVPYRPEENPPSPAEYGAMVARVTKDWGVTLMFEPGRVIAGNSGVMMTRVIRIKPGVNSDFVVVDAAMNDLMRPAIYDAWHHFEAVEPTGGKMTASIVGPICESSDIFTKEREVDRVETDDLGIFRTAGAYGATMANTYNSRPLVPEVLADGDKYAIVAERIEPATIMAAEHVPDWLK